MAQVMLARLESHSRMAEGYYHDHMRRRLKIKIKKGDPDIS